MNAMTAERAPAITVALPLTDERSTLVAVRRLLVAGALAVSLAGVPLTVAWVSSRGLARISGTASRPVGWERSRRRRNDGRSWKCGERAA